MSEWNQGLTLVNWTEVSSSVPHFLQVGLLLSPIIYKCLLKVLCPVSRPVTTLDCVLLTDKVRARNQFSSLSLCTTRTMPPYQMLVFHPVFYLFSYILPRDPQERLRSNKPLNRTVPCKLVSDFISLHPSMPRDPIQPHSVPGRDHRTPSGTVIPTEMLFWQPEALSEPPNRQSKY